MKYTTLKIYPLKTSENGFDVFRGTLGTNGLKFLTALTKGQNVSKNWLPLSINCTVTLSRI